MIQGRQLAVEVVDEEGDVAKEKRHKFFSIRTIESVGDRLNVAEQGKAGGDAFRDVGDEPWGLSQGLRKAGFRVVAAVEADALAASTYRLNHAHTALWQCDIRTIDTSDMMDQLGLKAGELDLLAGCPPCQGFSSMRTLNGKQSVRDRRNSLTDEYLRFVLAFKPRTLVFENVPGLATRRRFREFELALRRFGYQTAHDVVDAADYSIPQHRRRLILLAVDAGEIALARPGRLSKTVRRAIGDLPAPRDSRDPLHKIPGKRRKRIEELIRKIPKNGGGRLDLPRESQLKCHRSCDGFQDVYGRMHWDRPAPTITSGCINPSKGRFLHPQQNRAVTAREAALLQGFPRSYKFDLSRGFYGVATLIGNAFPPEFIRRHAAQLVRNIKRRSLSLVR